MRRLAIVLAIATLGAGVARAQELPPPGEPEEPPRVVLIGAAAGPVEGFDELVSSLRALLGEDIELVVVVADRPTLEDADVGAWGAAVARSEGADAAIWLQRGQSSPEVTLWVARPGTDGDAIQALVLREADSFDRGRTLALAVRSMLEPLLAGTSPTAPDPTEDEATEASLVELRPEQAPASSSGSSEPEAPLPPRSVVALRPLIGPTLRSEGPAPGVRLAIELAFLTYGWVGVAGELVRPEPLPTPRERAYVRAEGGAELSWRFLRGKLGVLVAVALGWLDGQAAALGATVGGLVSAAVELAPEVFLELPVSVEGAVARAASAAVPDVEVSVALLLGLSPPGW